MFSEEGTVNEELFEELLESVTEGGKVLRGEVSAAQEQLVEVQRPAEAAPED